MNVKSTMLRQRLKDDIINLLTDEDVTLITFSVQRHYDENRKYTGTQTISLVLHGIEEWKNENQQD